MWRRKVLWSEGLFLRPQHFQQQERYLENLIERRARAIRSYGWGFEALELDDAAAAIGSIALRQASGILPDGTPFNLPADDPPPAPLIIRPDHPKDSLVYLGVVADRPGVPSARSTRTSASRPCATAVARSTWSTATRAFRIRRRCRSASCACSSSAAAELSGAYCAMPIARVVERRADGQVILDRQFVGPFLSVNDCGLLRGYLGELRGLLSQRVDALAGRMAQPGRGGVAEIADFLLLQTVNRASALFEHLCSLPRLHPESFYADCVQLAGDLAAFGPERRMSRPFPAYDHDDHGLSFKPVMAQLRLALSMVLEQSAIPIELHDRKYGVRVAVIPDKGLLTTASFVLAVAAQVPSETLRQRFPGQLKVGPGREDPGPGEPAAARHRLARLAGRAAADPVSRRLQLFRARYPARTVGTAQELPAAWPCTWPASSPAWNWNSGRCEADAMLPARRPPPATEVAQHGQGCAPAAARPHRGEAASRGPRRRGGRAGRRQRHGGAGAGGGSPDPFGDIFGDPFAGAAAPSRSDPFDNRPARRDHDADHDDAYSSGADLPPAWAALDNPLIDAAHPLLTVITQLRGSAHHPDPSGLRDDLARAVTSFEQAAAAAGAPRDSIIAARYLLCTFLDETAASTPWGGQGAWASDTLLVRFHNETWGGEKSFQLLSRLSESAAEEPPPARALPSLPGARLRGPLPGAAQRPRAAGTTARAPLPDDPPGPAAGGAEPVAALDAGAGQSAPVVLGCTGMGLLHPRGRCRHRQLPLLRLLAGGAVGRCLCRRQLAAPRRAAAQAGRHRSRPHRQSGQGFRSCSRMKPAKACSTSSTPPPAASSC